MNDRRAFLLTAGSAALTLATVGWKSPALANSLAKTTSLMLPLSGVFFYPPEPMACTQGENVVLSGDTHVVTVWPPEPFLRMVNVYLNMAGVQGTGLTSGSLYVASGATKFIGLEFPPEPDFTLPVFANFLLEPTNGCASVPLPLNFELVFASDGTLLPQSSVYPPEPT
jgi:hypothetical protein